MDSEYYHCGTCKHGNLYDQCYECEDQFEAERLKTKQQQQQQQLTKQKDKTA